MANTSSEKETWLGHIEAGKRNFQQGQHDAAAQAFYEATKVQPDRVEGWVNLGSTLIEAKRHDVAVAALDRALTMNPDLMIARLLLGDAMCMLGHWQAAVSNYTKAVSLRRTPLSLIKLATALRADHRPEFAEGLYREAIELDPNFNPGRVGLATLQIQLSRFDEAEKQLNALQGLPLTATEQDEVETSKVCLAEYQRLHKAISALAEHDDPAPLETALRAESGQTLPADTAILSTLQRYANASHQISAEPAIPLQDLPDEWPLIEAMFMIPLANSVADYLGIKLQLAKQTRLDKELQVSVNMEAPIRAARACRKELQDPIKAELHLRHWHAMSSRGLEGFEPGHFKYIQNWVPSSPTVKRVAPALAGVTLRKFVEDIYCTVEPGYARAAMVLLAIADLHPFADGNGRIALIWLNRELEWAGLMPAIFPTELNFTGELNTALKQVQASDNDLSPIISVINRGQQFALEFCRELAQA